MAFHKHSSADRRGKDFGKRIGLVLCALLCMAFFACCVLWAEEAGSESDGPEAVVPGGEESAEEAPQEELSRGEETLYVENEWNFVDGIMDVSNGIPEDALGRLDKIRQAGMVIVATEPYYPPQEFIDPSKTGQDQYVGADIELAKLIAQRMGVKLRLVPLEFTDVLKAVMEGTADLAISGLAYTPGRAGSMELSMGYHYSSEEASTGLLIRKEDADEITGEEDLAERDIVAQSGSLQEMLMAENVLHYRQFRRVSSIGAVYESVEQGISDAAAVDIESAHVYLERNPDCGLMLMEGVSYQLEEQFRGDRVAAPKEEIQLMYFVNGVIQEVLDSGEYEEWFDEYTQLAGQLGL